MKGHRYAARRMDLPWPISDKETRGMERKHWKKGVRRRLSNGFLSIGIGLLILSMLLSTVSLAASPGPPAVGGSSAPPKDPESLDAASECAVNSDCDACEYCDSSSHTCEPLQCDPCECCNPDIGECQPEVVDAWVTFDDGTSQLRCVFEEGWQTVEGTVHLTLAPCAPPDTKVRLIGAWHVVQPPYLGTDQVYEFLGWFGDGERFSMQAWWPGVRECDLVVENHVGTHFRDECDNLVGRAGSLDYYWYPYRCSEDPPPCDDGDACTTDSCDPTRGCVFTPITCDDGIDCTIDYCDQTLGCVSEPDDSLCDNGLFCDGTETCDPSLGCLDGAPVDCDDEDICTDDSCDEIADECINEFDVTNDPSCEPCFGVVCDDGLWCNGLETCDPATGLCVDGTPPDCSDDLYCTVNETCDETTDTCVSDPRDCSDDLFCTINETCDETTDTCTSDPRNCSDDLFCTINETCDETANACVSDPRDCSDDLFCTINETCDETANACVSDPRDCSDDLFCTINETCDETTDTCTSDPRNCDDEDICTDDSCDEIADECINEFDVTNDPSCEACFGVVCDDGLWCNGLETCDPATGLCVDGTPPDCSDDLYCTVNETCDETTDTCVSDPRDCSDDLYCTINETCDETANACVSDPRDCSDEEFCTVNERCDEIIGACMSDPRNCDDEDICTDDSCDETADECVNLFDATNDPSCEVAPVLSADGVARCPYWWAEFYSDVTAEYYVKVNLDGHKEFEESGTFIGSKSFRDDWGLRGSGERTMRIVYWVKAGEHKVGNDEKWSRNCGTPPPGPTPTPVPPTPTPVPTPTVFVEVLGVERLPVTGGMPPLAAFPSLPLILSSLAFISGGFLLRPKE